MKCFKKKVILVIGQPSKQTLSKWLEETFEIKDDRLDVSSYIKNNIEINIKFCNFNQLSFSEDEFETFCKTIKSNLKAIVCIQKCNPRSQTIIEDTLKLCKVFTAQELKHKIFIFVITNESLNKIQNILLDHKLGFKYLLQLENQKSEDNYKNNKIIFNQRGCKHFRYIVS